MGAIAQDAPESRKSPAAAFALSFFVPGAGQVCNGDYLKGAVMFGGALLTAGPIILTVADVLELDDDRSGTEVHAAAVVGIGIVLWSWIDAPLSAAAINRRIDAGAVAFDLGPRLRRVPSGQGASLQLVSVDF